MREGHGSIVDEPVRGSIPDASFLSLTGPERMRAFVDEQLPFAPFNHLLGVRTTHAGPGSCTVVMPASPWLQTQAGFFLSGVTAMVADGALGGAILSALPAWSFPVTSDLNFTYLRPVRVDAGKLIARGRLIDAGRNQATSEATIEDGEGRLLAHATTRCFIRVVEPFEAAFEPSPPVVYDTPDPYERPVPTDVTVPTELKDLSGVEVLRMVARGELPAPFMQLTGHTFDPDVQPGRIASSYPATPWFRSPAGTVYGGIIAFVADGLNTAAATSILEAGTGTASLDLKVHFVRPAIADGRTLMGVGEVVHGGRSLIVARSEIRDEAGKAIAVSSGSFMRRPIRDWVPVITQ